jgi:hypothetical protein
MAQGLITYNTKVDNGGATDEGLVLPLDLNDIKNIVNQNSADAEARLQTIELGNVQGPGSATVSAIALYDNVSGKILKNSVVLVDASGNITGINELTLNGFLAMQEGASASTPASGYGVIYTKSSDSGLYYKNDSGTEFNVLDTGPIGNVVGPGASTDNALARFDLATGELLQDSVALLSDTGRLTGISSLSMSADLCMDAMNPPATPPIGVGCLFVDIADDKLYYGNNSSVFDLTEIGGDASGPGASTDNALARFDLTTGKLVQNSVAILDDAGNLSGINDLTILNHFLLAEGAAAATPASGYLAMYAKSGDSKLYYKNDAGTEFGLGGDVSGPGSSTINALTRFSTTSGKDIKSVSATLTDAGVLAGIIGIGPGAGNDLDLTLGDDAGVNKISIKNASNAEVASLNSLGALALAGGLAPSSVSMPKIGTSTYGTLEDANNLLSGVGIVNAGYTHITDGGAGTANVAQVEYRIRATDDDTAQVLFGTVPATVGLALTDNDLNYLYVEYNAGAPQVIATVTKRSDYNTNVYLGTVYRAGTVLHPSNGLAIDLASQPSILMRRIQETALVARVTGIIISETGTRNYALTAGAIWHGLNRVLVNAIDTSGGSTFTGYYQDGVGGWTTILTQTQINNTQFDDGTGVLQSLTGSRYGVQWEFKGINGDNYVVFGRGNYTLSAAQDAAVPANLPPHFEDHAYVVGRIIVQNGAATFTEVATPFQTQFATSVPVNHSDLGGLGDDDHTQYVLTDGTRDTAKMSLTDGITAPGVVVGLAQIYVDTADGDLKVIFGDGVIKTIVTDV